MTNLDNDIKKHTTEDNPGNHEDIKLKTYEQALKLAPNDPIIYNNLGICLIQLRKFQKAIKCFKKAIHINPSFETAHSNLGNVFQELGKCQEAVSCYQKAINIKPHFAEAHYNLGKVFQELGKCQEAVSCYQKVIQLNPNYMKAYNNLGNSFQELGNKLEAIKCFKKAIHINPSFETAHSNLGNVFQELGKCQEAVSCYQKAINIKPHFAEAHYNLGNLFNKIGKTRNAILSYKEALKHNPRYNSARYNLARAQLAINDFENGWQGFELRDGNTKKFYEKLGVTKEQVWNGNKFNGSLLIHADQGIGDEILYSSMFSNLVNYHKDLIVSADERLINLFERSFPKIEFISRKKTKAISKIRKINAMKNSRHLLAGSLGKYFRNSLKDFKHNQNSWLAPNADRVEEFKKYFSVLEKIKVGLSWKSTAKNYKDKNISLIDLAKIFPADYFEIINLQYGDIKSDKIKFEEKAKRKLIHFDDFDYTNDLEGLAALICNCDLVASISNATVHLAGALGKHTWILISTNAQWYWHSSRDKSLWYPNIRIFRQKNKGVWDDVIDRIKIEVFSKFINKKNKFLP